MTAEPPEKLISSLSEVGDSPPSLAHKIERCGLPLVFLKGADHATRNTIP